MKISMASVAGFSREDDKVSYVVWYLTIIYANVIYKYTNAYCRCAFHSRIINRKVIYMYKEISFIVQSICEFNMHCTLV